MHVDQQPIYTLAEVVCETEKSLTAVLKVKRGSLGAIACRGTTGGGGISIATKDANKQKAFRAKSGA